eukprot:362732-Chlamydomonas_euryale.AAC.5
MCDACTYAHLDGGAAPHAALGYSIPRSASVADVECGGPAECRGPAECPVQQRAPGGEPIAGRSGECGGQPSAECGSERQLVASMRGASRI